MRIGIIAALPGEIKPLVREWSARSLQDGTRVWTHAEGNDVWVAACSGMGADAARRAFSGAEASGALDSVLSVGWAGALTPEIKPGESYAVSIVIDAQTGEQFCPDDAERTFRLVTTARVADAYEKARLRNTYPGAAMVDMEAATVVRLAQMRKIPFACIKGVSDSFSARLPDLNPFITSKGQLRLIPFVVHIVLRPQYWRAVAALSRHSDRAARGMCQLILEFMEEKNVDRLNPTGNP